MDFTQQNLETLASLRLQNVSVEHRVVADRKMGERYHFFNGVWWHSDKPFFYLPASFLLPLRQHESPPIPSIDLGRNYHVVPAGSPGNRPITTNEVSDSGQCSPY